MIFFKVPILQKMKCSFGTDVTDNRGFFFGPKMTIFLPGMTNPVARFHFIWQTGTPDSVNQSLLIFIAELVVFLTMYVL